MDAIAETLKEDIRKMGLGMERDSRHGFELRFGQLWAGPGAVLPGTRFGKPMGKLVIHSHSAMGTAIYQAVGTAEEIEEYRILSEAWDEMEAVCTEVKNQYAFWDHLGEKEAEAAARGIDV